MNLNATILGQAIAFFLYVLFCMKYIWKPLMATISKRQKEIADGIALAEVAKNELNSAHIKANEHIKKAKAEAKLIIDHANKLHDQILKKAKIESEKRINEFMNQARAEICAERIHASEELRKQVGILAIAIAKKIIEHSIMDETINNDIIDKFISEL